MINYIAYIFSPKSIKLQKMKGGCKSKMKGNSQKRQETDLL